jgi:hypothetical protein
VVDTANRVVIQSRLERAQAAVRLATYHVRQQRIRVTQLEREGPEHEAAQARVLLTNLEEYLALQVADRDRAITELLDFDGADPRQASAER